MEKKLKILAAGDLHGSLDIAKRLAKKALDEKVDLIVLAGDIYGYEHGKPGILKPFSDLGHRVLFVPGNCDFDEDIKMLGEGKNLHGYYVKYNDVGIVGIGSPNWKLRLLKSDFDLVNKNFSKMKADKSVLVSHLHAAGTRGEAFGFKGWTGDEVLRDVVKKFQPDLLISAHIHEAEGIEDLIGKTKIVQVGRGGSVLEI